MKKFFLCASMALIGVACSKSNDDDPQSSVVTPKEKTTGQDRFNQVKTLYTTNDKGLVTKVEKKTIRAGQEVPSEKITQEISYSEGETRPNKVVYQDSRGKATMEYSYNGEGQITHMKKTVEIVNGSTTTKTVDFEYKKGRLSAEVYKEDLREVKYTYPDANTVVATEGNPDDTSVNTLFTRTTYTLKGGIVEKTLEEKGNGGKVNHSVERTYEYDPAVKEPERSTVFDYLNNTLDPNIGVPTRVGAKSQQALKSVTNQMKDMTHVIAPSKTTYEYEVDDKGYPTKVTETTTQDGREISKSTYNYSY